MDSNSYTHRSDEVRKVAKRCVTLCKILSWDLAYYIETAEELAEKFTNLEARLESLTDRIRQWSPQIPENLDSSAFNTAIDGAEEFLRDARDRLEGIVGNDPDNVDLEGRFIGMTTIKSLDWILQTHTLMRSLNAVLIKVPQKIANEPVDRDGMRRPQAAPQLYVEKIEFLTNRLLSLEQLNPYFDIQLARKWLDTCDTHHGDHCGTSERTRVKFAERPLWLIDTRKCCLVPAESDHRYVALSYVWGPNVTFRTLKQNLEAMQVENALAEAVSTTQDSPTTASISLPKTIQDTIALTKLLGERYVWIDALCIVQDDEEEKKEHLRAMGSIYANAYATIVAANGTASDGLRGIPDLTAPFVRKPRRMDHGKASYYLQDCIREHSKRLHHSTWNQRAWTFQEQIFSRRLIVFSEAEVSWECHCAVWFEGISPVEKQCRRAKQVIPGFSFSPIGSLEHLHKHIEQYNRRKLTFPEDALDAFGGILGALDQVFPGGFVAGLPVRFFHRALLWYSQGMLRPRRPQISSPASIAKLAPTWSWAHWEGNIAVSGEWFAMRDILTVTGYRRLPDVCPEVRWVYRADANASPILLPKTDATSPYSYSWGPTGKSDGNKSNEDCRAEAEEEQTLLQKASAAFEGKAQSHLLYGKVLQAEFAATMTHRGMKLTAGEGESSTIGTINLHRGNAPPNILNKQVKCVLVAISSTFTRNSAAYNVLWIIRNSGGVACRVGSGRLPKSVWDEHAMSAGWVDLVLG